MYNISPSLSLPPSRSCLAALVWLLLLLGRLMLEEGGGERVIAHKHASRASNIICSPEFTFVLLVDLIPELVLKTRISLVEVV